MYKHEDIITYDVYELDLHGLRQKLERLSIKEAVVYGIGNNGRDTYRMFKNLESFMGLMLKHRMSL